jgi:transcriptional regulator with GAF, ATPase, and Fis domain
MVGDKCRRSFQKFLHQHPASSLGVQYKLLFNKFYYAMSILVAWLGKTDLRAAAADPGSELGPVLGAVKAFSFDSVHLLSNHPQDQTRAYASWLHNTGQVSVIQHETSLTSPTNHKDIYREATRVLSEIRKQKPGSVITLHLSPGTPAMASIWLLLAKTRFPARLIESSLEAGVREVEVPFELSVEFSPGSDKAADDALTRLMQGLPPESPAFTSIIHKCASMKRTVAMAHRLALREVPVLIQGESGTGKELFARAIHQASTRNGKPFVAVNCGAIPLELVDAEFFGHEKGAFTGAATARAGYFESADGGTLFLDEIGELPLASQVRLLRVLQEHEVTRVGASLPKSINIRVIAATNRLLPEEVRGGRFREDLFYRLAVGVLQLPPLRHREGDMTLLIDSLLAGINAEASSQPGYKHKKLDVSARNILLRHGWPGNVRELHNALLRASIWASGEQITSEDIAESLAVTVAPSAETVLGRPLSDPISLPDLLNTVSRHYLQRAMTQAHGNKTEAARLLGLGSYQTLTNWLQKYEVT